jgi:hypothetical protein
MAGWFVVMELCWCDKGGATARTLVRFAGQRAARGLRCLDPLRQAFLWLAGKYAGA